MFPIWTGQRRRRLKGSDLHRAVINADMEEIASLLKRGVPMEVQNCRGLTPLQVFEKPYSKGLQIKKWTDFQAPNSRSIAARVKRPSPADS